MPRSESPYDYTKEVCGRLVARGIEPTYGLVAVELPGTPSKTTVLKHLRRWKEERDAAASVQAGLSEGFIQAALAEIGSHVYLTVEKLQQQLSDFRREADEALAELEKEETRIQSLEAELVDARDQAFLERQEAQRQAAVASERIDSLSARVRELEQEREHLMTSGEAARTEAAKGQLRAERADLSAQKAEEQAKALQVTIERLQQENTALEKRLAVAEARFEEMRGRLIEGDRLEDSYENLRREHTNLSLSLKDAEKRAELAEQRVIDMEGKIQEMKQALALARNAG